MVYVVLNYIFLVILKSPYIVEKDAVSLYHHISYPIPDIYSIGTSIVVNHTHCTY